ncbi:MAG: glycosyltransferase family 39 protein [Candidatus Eisenbacteria sp.]|nr:glycosyltransferase family 39 protein [Candidatus Eisenbacteria bacterium]
MSGNPTREECGPGGGRAWRDDLLLLAAALIIRVLHGLAIRSEPLFEYPQIDASAFWETARALVHGAGPEGVFYKPPLLAHLLALLMRVFGESPGTARLALLGLSALAAPLTARLARPLLGRWWALTAGGVVALYAPAVFYGAELLPATLALLLNLVTLLCLVRAEAARREGQPDTARRAQVATQGEHTGTARRAPVRSHGHLWFIAAGLALGLSALARPTILLFLPLLLIRYRRRQLRSGALLLLATAALAVAPATIHNVRHGDSVLISSNGGINFYMGNHAQADGRSARAPELPTEPRAAARVARVIAEGQAGRELRPSEVSQHWVRRGIHAITHSPGRALGLEIRKLYYAVNNRDTADNIDFVAIQEVSAPLRVLPLRFGILFVFALPGILILRRRPAGRLLLLYGATVLAALLLFFVVGRFRLPLLPVMAIGAVAGARRMTTALREGFGRLVPLLLLLLAGGVITFSSLWGVGQDRSWHYYYLCGDAFYRQGNTSEAILAYEESLTRNLRVAPTLNALAYAYAEAGTRLERAETLARSALSLSPARRRHYLDTLGWVLYKQADLEAAATAFEEAIELFPPGEERFRVEALEHLALVREAQGRELEAERLRSEARRIDDQQGRRH